jgi:RNA polymerase sigma factor (sigma-70 family)
MAKEPLGSVLHYIRQMACAPANQELTDKELLESFVASRDEGAFAALVQRHGPLVWGVCRRVLHQDQDAEDAFQATFLVLARKACRVRWQADVGNWLSAVALRTAMKAKSGASRRYGREGPLQDMPATPHPALPHLGEGWVGAAWLEIRPILDEELNRLPLKYRAPVVLHYFEGKTYAQAAQALGWPAGTVSTRLAQARHLLRGRLARRGVALSSALLAAALSENAATAMAPAALVDTTVKAATLFAGGQALTGCLISTKVATLTHGVLKTMFLTKLKIGAALVLTLGALGAGAGVMGYRMLPAVEAKGPTNGKAGGEVAADDQPKPDKPKQEIERLRKENEELRRELSAIRDKLNELNPKLGAKEHETEPVTFQGKPADYWLKMLKDRDPEFRKTAIKALGAFGVDDKRVIPTLIEAFRDKDRGVADAAASALGDSIGKAALPALLQSLKGKDNEVRKWAAEAVGRIGPEAKDAVPVLIEFLQDKDIDLRTKTVYALARIAPESKSAIPALIKLMKDEDQNVRGVAPFALSRFGHEGVAPLIEALKDPDNKVRAGAAGCLSQVRGEAKAAVPVLIQALRDKDELVRKTAALALHNLGSEAVPALVEALKDKDPVIRAGSVQVLSNIGAPTASSALPAIRELLGDENERVRRAADQAFRNLQPRDETDP